jgi:hypothetical protein
VGAILGLFDLYLLAPLSRCNFSWLLNVCMAWNGLWVTIWAFGRNFMSSTRRHDVNVYCRVRLPCYSGRMAAIKYNQTIDWLCKFQSTSDGIAQPFFVVLREAQSTIMKTSMTRIMENEQGGYWRPDSYKWPPYIWDVKSPSQADLLLGTWYLVHQPMADILNA